MPVKRVALAVVVIASYFTYFHRYAYPAAPFWDENYHIASAQKDLNGIFFMELHPPLGKLLIALGEWLLHPNGITSWFVSADYASRFPEGFSFAGTGCCRQCVAGRRRRCCSPSPAAFHATRWSPPV